MVEETAAKKQKHTHWDECTMCVCFTDGGGAERLADKGSLEWMFPLFFLSLYLPCVTFELSVVRGCISGSRSVYAAAGDESEAVEEINKNKRRGDKA